MIALNILFFVLWLLFRWHYDQGFPRERIDAHLNPITSKCGIEIVNLTGDSVKSV